MKHMLTIFFIFLTIYSFAQVPVNDECSGAIVLPTTTAIPQCNSQLPYCSGANAFSNANATLTPNSLAIPEPPCWFPSPSPNTQRDVWFTFTTPASGGSIDINIELIGGTIVSPQIALYRGDCSGLAIQQAAGQPPACATAAPNSNDVSMNVIGLDASCEVYYLRVGDNGSAGTFELCLTQFFAPVLMSNGSSQSCSGTIFDQGGPGANSPYPPNPPNASTPASPPLIYTICPQQPSGCLKLNFSSYDIDCADGLYIYNGANTTSTQDLITVVRGTGNSLTVEAPSGCMTLRFVHDNVIQGNGFEAIWSCDTSCTQTRSACSTPDVITSLPYVTTTTTCGAGNNYDATDACGSTYMNGEDRIFAYTSAGNECISINLSGTSIGTGLFVMDGCPNSDATDCIFSQESSTGNPSASSIELEEPGTYYIVVATEGCPSCTDFEMTVSPAPCPLIVNPNVSANDLAQKIAGKNVNLTNVELNCPPGAYGTFEGGPSAGSVNGGIILSTGFAIDAEGPNMADGVLIPGADANTPIGAPGDSLLTALSGVTTVDACILEFDVFAPTEDLTFRYIFASEEYKEWILYDTAAIFNGDTTAWNDVFAFNISGPGINGSELLSFIPGTTTPVTVSTVNDQNWTQFFVDNPAGEPQSIGTAYDGYTTVLTAATTVIPCTTYHIRLAIGDGLDQFYDSGVLIEAGSLFGNDIEFEIAGTSVGNELSAAENCLDGSITVTLAFPSSDTVLVPLDIQGTAINGIDYDTIPDTLVFLPNQTTLTIPIIPIADGITEPTEDIKIYLYERCSESTPSDSAIIYIRDDINGQFSMPDTAIICNNPPLTMPLSALNTFSDNYTYSWSPNISLSSTSTQNPLASPTSDQHYVVIAGNGICFDTLEIDVLVANLDITEDTVLCDPNLPVQLNAVTNRTGSTFEWIPSTDLTATNIPNPVATPTATTTYTLNLTTDICTITDDVTIVILPDNLANIISDTEICEGTPISIGGTQVPTVSYLWSADNDPNFQSTEPNPSVTPLTTTTYTVASTSGICTDQQSVTVNVLGTFDLDLDVSPQNAEIDQGSSAQLVAAAVPTGNSPMGAISYSWSPTTALSNPNIANPIATPFETTTYTVTATNAAGCTATETITITVIPPEYHFPNAFTPDGSNNRTFKPVIQGAVTMEYFRIFDRWGQLVYDNPDVGTGWDGNFNGQPLPQGTYVYMAQMILPTGVRIDVQGDLLLIR